MKEQDLKYWFAILKIPEIGDHRIKLLFDHFSSPKKIWESDFNELRTIEGIGDLLASRIVNYRRGIDIENIDTVSACAANVLCLSDKTYPLLLKNIYDPPPVLFIKGEFLDSDARAIAIVGTRNPSRYGEEAARIIVRGLVEAGFTIVSGLAHGIDSRAHEAALEFNGRTIAVLGTGVDMIYPYVNRRLSEEIARNGALLSEFPAGTKIEKWNFPRRNRIISGLSLGTLVIEGTSDSGSLITAKFALEQNREVFAVPGAIDSALSGAPNSLIKQGAKLVQSVNDIFEELNIDCKGATYCASVKPAFDPKDLPEEERAIYRCLMSGTRHIDDISKETGYLIKDLFPFMMSLNMKNIVKELPGKHFAVLR